MARNRKRNRQRVRERSVERPMASPIAPQMPPTMPGAMPTGMGAGMGAPAPTMPPADAVEGEEGESSVTPEEQALYHKFMENYYTVMYVNGQKEGPKGEPPLIEEVQDFFRNIPDPIDALANAAATVVSYLSDSAEAAGKPIPGDVLMHAGTEVISDLAELAENGGHHEYTEDEIGGALTKGFMLYKDMNSGKLNMDEIKGDYDMLTAADKEGRLEEVLPGAGEAVKRLPKPAPEEEMQAPVQQPAPAQPAMQPRGMGRP